MPCGLPNNEISLLLDTPIGFMAGSGTEVSNRSELEATLLGAGAAAAENASPKSAAKISTLEVASC